MKNRLHLGWCFVQNKKVSTRWFPRAGLGSRRKGGADLLMDGRAQDRQVVFVWGSTWDSIFLFPGVVLIVVLRLSVFSGSPFHSFRIFKTRFFLLSFFASEFHEFPSLHGCKRERILYLVNFLQRNMKKKETRKMRRKETE